MSELVEIFKIVLENPSPLFMGMFVSVLVIYKSKDILGVFFDIKDMKKKRIIQKLEENKTLSEMNYLNPNLKTHYERLCEEAQIHAIIGCQYCSKEMAQYIMSRKNISCAIRVYHRIRDEVEVRAGSVVPVVRMKSWRIKLNSYGGIFFYVMSILLGAAPFLLVIVATLTKAKMVLSPHYYLDASVNFLSLFLLAFFFLYQSVKPKLSEKFCNLEENEKILKNTDAIDKAA